MKNLLLFFCFLSFSLSAQNVNLMTFNIRYDTDIDGLNKWANRKDHAAQMLTFYDVDVCGMQEALIGQIKDLEQRLPNYAYFGKGRDDGQEKGEFSPIFYNTKTLKLLQSDTFWLSETPEKPSKGWDAAFPRLVTWGLFEDLNSKAKFYVFNTHFDHMGQIARKQSAKLLLAKSKEIAKDQVYFLMGDFNSIPSDEPMVLIKNELNNTEEISTSGHFGPESTFSGFESREQENKKIYHIFCNNKKIIIKKHATLSNTWAGLFASDHHPVMVSVELKK